MAIVLLVIGTLVGAFTAATVIFAGYPFWFAGLTYLASASFTVLVLALFIVCRSGWNEV